MAEELASQILILGVLECPFLAALEGLGELSIWTQKPSWGCDTYDLSIATVLVEDELDPHAFWKT